MYISPEEFGPATLKPVQKLTQYLGQIGHVD